MLDFFFKRCSSGLPYWSTFYKKILFQCFYFKMSCFTFFMPIFWCSCIV